MATAGAQMGTAETQREGELAGLEVEQPQVRMGVHPQDRLGPLRGDLLDLHAALGRAHHQHPLRGAVERGGEVVLVRDVGRRRPPGRGAP